MDKLAVSVKSPDILIICISVIKVYVGLMWHIPWVQCQIFSPWNMIIIIISPQNSQMIPILLNGNAKPGQKHCWWGPGLCECLSLLPLFVCENVCSYAWRRSWRMFLTVTVHVVHLLYLCIHKQTVIWIAANHYWSMCIDPSCRHSKGTHWLQSVWGSGASRGNSNSSQSCVVFWSTAVCLCYTMISH